MPGLSQQSSHIDYRGPVWRKHKEQDPWVVRLHLDFRQLLAHVPHQPDQTLYLPRLQRTRIPISTFEFALDKKAQTRASLKDDVWTASICTCDRNT
jgi:hypothetical protein